MNKRDTIINVAESGAHTVYAHHLTAIDTNNGVLNEDKLVKERKKVFNQSITYLQEQFLRETQYYPINDISEVAIDLDFIAIDRRHWTAIINYLETHE